MKTLSIISAAVMTIGLSAAMTTESNARGHFGGRGFSGHGSGHHASFRHGGWRGGYGHRGGYRYRVSFGGYGGYGGSSCIKWSYTFSRWVNVCGY